MHRVGQVARDRECVVVILGIHRHDLTAKRNPEVHDVEARGLVGQGRLGDDRDATLEQVRARVLDTVLFRARDRVRTDVLHPVADSALDRLHDPGLGAARVREDRAIASVRGGPQYHVRDGVHRRADDDEVRVAHAFREVGRERVDGPEFDRAGEGLRVAADAHNAPGDAAGLGRKPDRAADQPHADNRDLLE